MANRFGRAEFRWNTWNVDHIAAHGIAPSEAEYAVRNPVRGYPRRHRKDRWIVVGRVPTGEKVQVVFIFDPEETLYVIHAMVV